MQKLITDKIEAIRIQLRAGPVGLAWLEPEEGAAPHRCFENAAARAQCSGGGVIFGWTFNHRLVASIPGPGYLFMTHHAVWHAAPDGRLVDVTPHPDPKHRPYGTQDGILFLVDRAALPVRTGNQVAPLPMRFFALADDAREVVLFHFCPRFHDKAAFEDGEIGEELRVGKSVRRRGIRK